MATISFSSPSKISFPTNLSATDLMAEVQELEKAINTCNWSLVRTISQSLTSSGRQLAIQHIQKNSSFNPLPSAENLFKSLASSTLQWEDETKHQLARAARLFLELSCMKCAKENREIYEQTAKDLREQIDKLLQYTKDEQVGLRYELTCSSEALKLMERLDTTTYFFTLLRALGDLSIGSIPELLRLIPSLINKMQKDWFLEALYVSWTGLLARDNRPFFESHCKEISQYLDTLETAQTAVEFLGDIIWQGSPDIQYEALVGKIGLINLASQQAPKRSFFNFSKKMWPVRYRAVQIISTLIHHKDEKIVKKATEALLNCSLKESNPKVRKLFDELEKHPEIRNEWKQQFESKKSVIFEQNLQEQEAFERQDKALKEREKAIANKESANELSSQAVAQERQEIEQERLFIEEQRQEYLAHKANAEAMYLKIFKGVNTVLDEMLAAQGPSPSQKENPPHFLCPILGTLMEDPVIAEDEHSYERSAIAEWVKRNPTSPITRAPMSNKFIANRSLRDAIEEHRKSVASITLPNPVQRKDHPESIPFYAKMTDKKITIQELKAIPLENFLSAIDKESQKAILYINLARNPNFKKSIRLLNGLTMTDQQLFLKAIHLDPNNGNAYRCLEATLSPGESIRLLNGSTMTNQQLLLKAIDLDPNDTFAYSYLGNSLPSQGSIQLLNGSTMTKQQLFLKAIDLNPNNADAYSCLGNSLPSQGNIRLLNGLTMTNQQLLLKAIDLDPDDAFAYSSLASILPSQGSIRLLNGSTMTDQQLLLKAIDLNPNDSHAYKCLIATPPPEGSIRLLNGLTMTDQQLLLKAIDLDPNYAFAYSSLAFILPSQGSIRLLNGSTMTDQQLLLKAIDLDPNYAYAYISLGYILPPEGSIRLLNGSTMNNQQLFLKAIDLDPNNADAYRGLGSILPSGGNIRLLNGTTLSQQQIYIKGENIKLN